MGENISGNCVVCGYREPVQGHVCDPDRDRIAEALQRLPVQLLRLAGELPPGAGPPAGDRVQTARATAPPAARLDVLNLLANGTDRLAAAGMAGLLAPHVRRWRTVEHVTVDNGDADTGRQVEIITWHQELAVAAQVRYSASRGPLTHINEDLDLDGPPAGQRIGHDDQVGLVPPAPWAHSWALLWQQRLGHRRQQVLRRRYTRGWSKAGLDPFDLFDLTEMHTAEQIETHNQQIRRDLGLHDYVPHRVRSDDPLGVAWQDRFGTHERGFVLSQDLRYLRDWLDEACYRDLDMARFAAELRALSNELAQVLGDSNDLQWLGRCPATLTCAVTGRRRSCGAGLWHDPYVSRVECRRCHSNWGPKKADLLTLAAAVRRCWPLDRRRRYITVERDALDSHRRMVRCPACLNPVTVTWREITAQTDRNRFWQPTAVACPHRCAEAGRLL